MQKQSWLLFAIALALAVSACGGGSTAPSDNPTNEDAGTARDAAECANPCGTDCCTAAQVCNAATSQCEDPGTCTAETNAAFCTRLGKACGAVTATDNCGVARTVANCGDCPAGQPCNAGVCGGCAPESDTAFCQRLEKNCGSVTARDNCNTDRTVNCGTCATGTTCNTNTNRCETACVPESDSAFCQRLGKQCGPASGIESGCNGQKQVAECGPCEAGSSCNAGQCVVCTAESDADFCLRLGVECGPTTGTDNCGATRSVVECGGCLAGETCAAGQCAPGTAPGNDDCAGATAIALDANGNATIQGDSTNATVSADSVECSGDGPDVVYSLTLAAPRRLQLTLNSAMDALVFIRRVCDSSAEADEVACVDEEGENATESLLVRTVPAGTYYVWVKGYDTFDAGPFTLAVSATVPPPAPANDVCTTPQQLVFTGDVATATGDTTNANDDSRGSCASYPEMVGGDVVFSFTLGADSSVVAKVTRDPGATGYMPAVYLRSDCGNAADEKACARHVSGVATATALSLPAGTHYVIVDGTDTAGGAFTLEVTKAAPVTLPDTCATAQVVTLVNGTATVSGDTSLAANDTRSLGCSVGSSPDLVYSVTTNATTNMSFKLSFTDPFIDPVLYVRRVCDATVAADELGCQDPVGSPATVRLSNVPAGTYFVWVDSMMGDTGSFTLEITASTPPANDVCANAAAIAIDATTGQGSAMGNLATAGNDDAGACGGATAGDLVYSLTLQSEKTVLVTVTPDAASATFEPVVYVRSACAQGATEKACGEATAAGAAASVSIPRLAPGTWYLYVDGANGTDGAFSVSVTLSDPPLAPRWDSCNGAETLTFDAAGLATASGDTTWGLHDTTGTCATADGPDFVYTFTTQQAQKVTATVTPTATATNFAPVVYLRSSCDQAGATYELTCATEASGSAAAVVNSLPAGTWFVWVDGEDASYGAFDLQVKLETAIAGPANDSCANASALTLTANTVTVTGTTTNAQNETEGSCGGDDSGDVVYALTTTADQKITAVVTPSATATDFDPVVYIRRSCGSLVSSDELGCGEAMTLGTGATALVRNAPAGTYYIWIDGGGYSANSGDFSLTVTLETPLPPPTNDTCARAEVITASTTVQGDTSAAANDYGSGPFSAVCDPWAWVDMPGPDVVYAFTPATTASFTVTATPSANFDVAIWLSSGTCGGTGSTCTALADEEGDGDPETLTFSGTAGTTYYIVVDGWETDALGSFTLQVQ